MKHITCCLLSCFIIGVAGCESPSTPQKTKEEIYENNAITNSGHELCIWPYRGGIAAMLTTDGPQRNTIQFAQDGINFEIKSYIKWGLQAVGLVCSLNTDKSPLEAMSWGLCHE
jgi:hypothetical protein